MPSFNGVNFFGASVVMKTVINPRAKQTNEYAGLSGLEQLDQGLRGRYTTVEGRLIGATSSSADLGVLQNIWYSYYDGNSYVLVDQFGRVWPDVKLEVFEPTGKVQRFASSGRYHQTYSARFEHLS